MSTTLAVLLLAATAAANLGLETLNSPDHEVAVAFDRGLQEVWLERRTGPWGASGPGRLLHARRGNGETWGPLVPLPFTADGASYGDPFFDDARQTLYFSSDRPHPAQQGRDVDLWRVRRADGDWQTPEPLPAPVNGPGTEYSPVRRGAYLYFAADRGSGGDLYRAQETSTGWQVTRLDDAINSPSGEWNLWVSEQQDLLVFEASGRAGNVSPAGDLYVTVADAQGRWRPPVPIESINGPGSELNPRMVGDVLVFSTTSTSGGDAELRAAPLDMPERIGVPTK